MKIVSTNYLRSFVFGMLILLLSIPMSGGEISSDDKMLSSTVKDVSFVEAVKEISQRFNVFFTFDLELVEGITVDDAFRQIDDVENAVEYVLHKTELNYRIIDMRYVIIYKNDQEGINSLKEMSKHLDGLIHEGESAPHISKRNVRAVPKLAPTWNTKKIERIAFTVNGIVTDQEGEPLIGVNIQVKGSNKGVSTDFDGRFSIDEIDENSILVVSYIGYQTQEVQVSGKSELTIVMIPDSQLLDEIVVVGFGEQKRESVVASVSSVKGRDLRMPNRSLSNNLAGQFAGLIAVQRSGEPGYDNAEFWIRGVSSFAGGTSPLVLVDGVPRDMNDIEPDEIETFTLLKDASATSVYGSEGANGVILITSKRGRMQKATKSYRGEMSRLTPQRTPNYTDSYNYLSLFNEQLINDDEEPIFSEEVLERYRTGEDLDLYPNVNWWDFLLKDHTNNMRHTLNFRGGGEKFRYFVSGAYFGEDGLFKVHDKYNNNSDVDRYNLRSNVDIDVTNSTLLSVDLSGQYLIANRPRVATNTLLKNFSVTPPHLFPPIYSDGSHSNTVSLITNPYNQLVERGYRKEWRASIQSKVQIRQNLDFLTDGLRFRGVISYDANSNYTMTRNKVPATFFAEGRDTSGNLILNQVQNETPFQNPSTSNTGNKNVYLETSFDYNKAFGKHIVGGMALYYQKERQLHNDALAFRKQAGVGRVTYSFDDRYIIEGNFSVTGSEQFAEGHRFGFFPAIGLGWNLTNEPFFPKDWVENISSLKFRVSVGRTGNDETGGARFLYRPTFNTSEGYFLGIGSNGPNNGV